MVCFVVRLAHQKRTALQLNFSVKVPGMSRAEANALYQGSVLNAKSLLSASLDVVATALRVNVPFRTSAGDGKGKYDPELS